jgi:hypothetical protein
VNAAVTDWFASTFAELSAQQEARAGVDHGFEPDLRLRAALAMIVAAAVLDDWFLPHHGGPDPAATIGAISDLITRGRRPSPAEANTANPTRR